MADHTAEQVRDAIIALLETAGVSPLVTLEAITQLTAIAIDVTAKHLGMDRKHLLRMVVKDIIIHLNSIADHDAKKDIDQNLN